MKDRRQENILKGKLVEQIKLIVPGFVILAHQDLVTGGIPDLSLSGYGRTTWWEVKHSVDRKFDTKGIQELTCLRLAAASYCRYIIYVEKNGLKQTLIIHPRNLKTLDPEDSCIGFDHKWVVNFMRGVHNAL